MLEVMVISVLSYLIVDWMNLETKMQSIVFFFVTWFVLLFVIVLAIPFVNFLL